MIPEKYRELLPPYWYENQAADYHFAAAGEATAWQHEKINELGKQFLLPYATYSLDVWDWIFFGDKQLGSYEQRRAEIRRKNLAKARFTLGTLETLGNNVGALKGIHEDFLAKEISFEFDGSEPVNAWQLSRDFARIRPVHVKGSHVVVRNEMATIVLAASGRSFEVEYPICGLFYPEGGLVYEP